MKLFIRQSFTQADETQQSLIQLVIDKIRDQYDQADFLTGTTALDKYSFVKYFEKNINITFTPKAFRHYRLGLIDQCDAMVFIRTSMSESGAFELAYNLYSKNPKPVFYAHWVNAPIKTTLLRELDKDYPVVYSEFSSANDILQGLKYFFERFELTNIKNTVA